MARYNTFVYGDGTEYGTSPANNNLLWTFIVDWDGDGYYSGVNEATRMVDLTVKRGRDNLINPGGRGFEFFKTGVAVATLNNSDGRYSPFNTSSPLYPDVTPGKFFKLSVKDTNTGTDYGVMQGVIDDIIPIQDRDSQYVRITMRDGLRWLKDQENLIAYYEGSSLQTIVAFILSDVDWPWGSAGVGDSTFIQSTLDYWWVWKSPALTELQELARSEAAHFFHGRDGTLYFYDRDYLYNRTKAVDQSVLLKDISLTQPWEFIRNIVNVEFHQKSEFDVDDASGTPENTLWQTVGSGGFIYIDAGETITIEATFHYQNFKMAGLNERYTHIVLKLDTVSDITASCPLTYLDPISAGTRITVVNNSGFDGYISSIELNGDVVYTPYKGKRTNQDATSQSAYGPRTLNLGGFWMEDPDRADVMGSSVLGFLKDPLTGVTIQFEDRPDYQFFFDLYDRVELTIDKYDIDDNFRVGSIEHTWLKENGQAVLTKMVLEPWITPLGGPS